MIPPEARSTRRHRIVFGVLIAIHLAFMIYAFPPEVVFGDSPYGLPDYQTHYQQISVLSQVVDRFGKFWAYDPNLLAGQPVGLIFDVDNKAYFLFVYGLTKIGVPRPIAFNLFSVISVAIAPFLILLAARVLELDRRARLIVFGFAVAIWHLDSTPRFCWGGGMVSFATASHASVLLLALYYRMLTGARRWRDFAAVACLLPLLLLVHVWSFAILVLPLVFLYLFRLRRHRAADHLRVWLAAVVALAVNLYWLWPALLHLDWIAPSAKVGQTTPPYVLWDYLERLVNPVNTGFIPQKTLFRFGAIIGAIGTLRLWRREGAGPYTYALLTFCWLFGLTYVAALIPGLRETEPYRFVVPAILFAALVAGPWTSELLAWDRLKALPSLAKVLLGVLLLLLVPRLAEQLFAMIPEIRPGISSPQLERSAKGSALPQTSSIAQTHRLQGVAQDFQEVAKFLREHATADGRALVQVWSMGEYLRWATPIPIIGGFPDRRIIHEAANLFRHKTEDSRYRDQGLAEYLVRYNIRWVITTFPYYPMIENRQDLLEPVRLLSGGHRVYKVRHRATYVAKGKGQVKASLNRIEVRQAEPAPGTQAMLLRFHHMPTLRCRPGCRVMKSPIPHDPVGFITVVGEPTLPTHFILEQRY
jgi:hypothetical protein